MSTAPLQVVDDVCRAATSAPGDLRQLVPHLVDQFSPLLAPDARAAAIGAALARLEGLDALQHHLDDPAVDEVMVNAGDEVWTDRDGELRRVGNLTPGSVGVVLERVLAPTGRRLDRTSPIVDVRLADGSRLCAVVSPIAVDGTALSIRRHRHRPISIEQFTSEPNTLALLHEIVERRCNVLISGATSSGKTSFIGALLGLVDPHDRIVICEDTTELAPAGRHLVRLEARPGDADGLRPIELAALVRAALRLRPDRLVIGEFRGVEVLAAVEAMNTGHDGSLSTCHANSAVDALRRVETLLMQASPSWPLAAIRSQVTRSIDVVVHLARRHDGVRRVVEVAEVIEAAEAPRVRTLADRSDLERRRR